MVYNVGVLNGKLNRRIVILMSSIVHKKIIIFIWNDAELNALFNEDKLSFQYFQKFVYFGQILN
jgi:hypothetical protein